MDSVDAFDTFMIYVLLLLLGLLAILVIVLIAVIVWRISRSIRNSRQPVQSVPARIVAKRGYSSGLFGFTAMAYFATFELEGGERHEFYLRAKDYGLLAEGDTGTLTFQGTRFRSFERCGSRRKGGRA